MASLFSSQKKEEKPQSSQQSTFEIERRMRVLEERISNMKSRLNLTEQNVIEINKKMSHIQQDSNKEIGELQKTVSQLNMTVGKIIKEFSLVAQKRDVDTLSKYIDLWNPAKFATVSTVEKIIDEKLKKVI